MDIDRGWLARSILALAMCTAGLFATPVRAQQRPCQDDVKRLCPQVTPGTMEARKCITDNVDKLSEACRQRLGSRARRQGYPVRLKGCESDLDKFCKGVMPGAGRLMKCLREHEKEVSAECKARLPGGHARTAANAGGGHGTAAVQGSPTVGAAPTAAATPEAK